MEEWKVNLRHRRNLTQVSNVCEAAPRSLFWVLNVFNELPEVCCKFPFILIGQSIMAFLTVQSWRVLKSWYTGGGPEKEFRRCFADGLNQSFVSFGVQAKWKVVIVKVYTRSLFIRSHCTELNIQTNL